MKKAEIIKNGNVNLNTVKLDKKVNKEIYWLEILCDYSEWVINYNDVNHKLPKPSECFYWFKKRLS